jgi:hypothetical protein
MAASDNRQWFIGDTVKIDIQITDPLTEALVDPTTFVMTSLKRGSTSLPVTGYNPPTHSALGTYQFTIPTTGFVAGAYYWVLTATRGDGAVTIRKDYFVLAPA